MSKFIINATNTNLSYAYYIPIISILWKRIGYNPINILLGNEAEWVSNHKTKYVYEQICKNSSKIFINRINGFRDSTIIQISRIFVSSYPTFSNEDYILTSDADMIPLNKEYYNQQDWGKQFHIFGSDAYGETRFPICYLGASVPIWRRVMRINTLDFQQAMTTSLDRRRDNWDYDELLFHERIKTSGLWPHNCQRIARGWVEGRAIRRMDRVVWNWQNQTDLIDCHSVRPGHTNWGAIAVILKQYSTPEEYKYFEDYTTTLNALP